MPRNAADYHGDNGLLYCGKCQTPKEAFFPKGLVLMGKNKHPVECACHKAERERQEATVKEQNVAGFRKAVAHSFDKVGFFKFCERACYAGNAAP